MFWEGTVFYFFNLQTGICNNIVTDSIEILPNFVLENTDLYFLSDTITSKKPLSLRKSNLFSRKLEGLNDSKKKKDSKEILDITEEDIKAMSAEGEEQDKKVLENNSNRDDEKEEQKEGISAQQNDQNKRKENNNTTNNHKNQHSKNFEFIKTVSSGNYGGRNYTGLEIQRSHPKTSELLTTDLTKQSLLAATSIYRQWLTRDNEKIGEHYAPAIIACKFKSLNDKCSFFSLKLNLIVDDGQCVLPEVHFASSNLVCDPRKGFTTNVIPPSPTVVNIIPYVEKVNKKNHRKIQNFHYSRKVDSILGIVVLVIWFIIIIITGLYSFLIMRSAITKEKAIRLLLASTLTTRYPITIPISSPKNQEASLKEFSDMVPAFKPACLSPNDRPVAQQAPIFI